MEKSVDYKFKVLLLGNSAVGKTCLFNQFVQGVFREVNDATIGVDFKLKDVSYKSDKTGNVYNIKLEVWDTSGQERFQAIAKSYY